MLSFIKNLFGRRQQQRGFFGRNAQRVNNHRGGVALGTIATIAAPFVIKKLRARMAQRQQTAPGRA